MKFIGSRAPREPDFLLRTHHFSGAPMHTASVLHKLFIQSVSIHAIRLNAIMAAVEALTHGAKASFTSLGRHLI